MSTDYNIFFVNKTARSSDSLSVLAALCKIKLAAPDHRKSRSTPIVIMTPITEGIGDIKRRKWCPSVCLLHASSQTCVSAMWVAGGVLFNIRLPPVWPFCRYAYACRGWCYSEQATDQWQQLYVLTSQITAVTYTSLDSAMWWRNG